RKAALPPAAGVLVFARDHAQQKSLGREARQQNLLGTMLARQPLEGRAFIVIDDVVTTGATLGEAIRAITAAGGEVLGAAAVANTSRQSDHFLRSRSKLVTSPDDGTTVSKRGAQVVPGSTGGDAAR
ncbi:MAG: phosphoribosyltransferase family protein, partial [Lacisediminihabitans sp.]